MHLESKHISLKNFKYKTELKKKKWQATQLHLQAMCNMSGIATLLESTLWTDSFKWASFRREPTLEHNPTQVMLGLGYGFMKLKKQNKTGIILQILFGFE